MYYYLEVLNNFQIDYINRRKETTPMEVKEWLEETYRTKFEMYQTPFGVRYFGKRDKITARLNPVYN